MKVVSLLVGLCLITSLVLAQCVGEIKDIKVDAQRGSIIVETEYRLNGNFVQLGRVRYLETRGTPSEIIQMIKDDIDTHCENLIMRVEENTNFIVTERFKRQSELSQPIIDNIKPLLTGYKATKTEAIDNFKGKEIKVTHDNKNTVSDIAE